MSTPMNTSEEQFLDGEGAHWGQDAARVARRSPRITRDNVFQAADELLLEGNRPTIDRVRMRLGRGSPNTINDHLDAWWARLGSRLRDVPERQFPQLPERVGQALQHLWTEALEGAQDALRATAAQKEQQISQREQALEAWDQQLTAREEAAAHRQGALEESVQMARDQLALVNRTVAGLEATLLERNIEQEEARSRIETLEGSCAELQEKIEAQASSHHAERTRLQEQHAAAEARWLMEVDRARQALKEAQQTHEHALKDQRQRLATVQRECDQLRQREQKLADWDEQLSERERAAAARQAALEESLQMAREQLALVNRTVAGLETTLLERNIEQEEARSRIEALEDSGTDLQEKLAAQTTAHQSERDQLHKDLAAALGDLKVATAVRQQLEERLRATGTEPTIQERRFRPRSAGASKPGGRRRGC